MSRSTERCEYLSYHSQVCIYIHLVCILQDLSAISRTSSESRLASQLSSATSLIRVGSAELPQLTDPEMIQKVVKKIKAIHVSCNSDDSNDVVHMLGSIQVCATVVNSVQ